MDTQHNMNILWQEAYIIPPPRPRDENYSGCILPWTLTFCLTDIEFNDGQKSAILKFEEVNIFQGISFPWNHKFCFDSNVLAIWQHSRYYSIQPLNCCIKFTACVVSH